LTLDPHFFFFSILNSAIRNPKSKIEGLWPLSFLLEPLAFYFVQHELKNRKTKAAAAISKKHQTFTIVIFQWAAQIP
jgi:hypothetical protein